MDLPILERRAVACIAGITVMTGAAQMAMPATLLALVALSEEALASHLFATVGMFMVLFGAATLHALRRPVALSVVLLWSCLQKLLAAVLVAYGVARGVFVPPALAIAAFDFVSGLLYLDLRRRAR
jgi:hypothetical protein